MITLQQCGIPSSIFFLSHCMGLNLRLLFRKFLSHPKQKLPHVHIPIHFPFFWCCFKKKSSHCPNILGIEGWVSRTGLPCIGSARPCAPMNIISSQIHIAKMMLIWHELQFFILFNFSTCYVYTFGFMWQREKLLLLLLL